jgi:hypothetical protein
VEPNRKRLDQGELLVGELRRDVEFPGRDGEQRPEAAIAMDSKGLVVLTAIRVAASAGVAVLAVDVRLDRGPVARLDIRHPWPDRHHLDPQFVPGDSRIAKERHLAEVAGVVGPAHPDPVDPDDCLARPRGRRFGHIDDSELLGLGELDGFHGGVISGQ